jgi:hypothetical protein
MYSYVDLYCILKKLKKHVLPGFYSIFAGGFVPVSRYTLLGSVCHSLLAALLLASTVAITVRHL